MENFTKNLRSYLESERIDKWSKHSSDCLRKLYNSVPKEIKFANFMDAFVSRPTWNIEESIKWMVAWMEKELKKVA